MFLLALLIQGVSSTNDNCAAIGDVPAGMCSYGDQYWEYSSGYYCDDNDTEVIKQKYYYDSSDCGETGTDTYSTYTYVCTDATSCNCDSDASLDDCSIAEIYEYDCDTTTDWDEYDAFVVDLCFEYSADYSAAYKCDGTDGVLYTWYSDNECDEVYLEYETYYCNDVESCTSDDDDWYYCGYYYYDITCTAGSGQNTIIIAAVMGILSMIF